MALGVGVVDTTGVVEGVTRGVVVGVGEGVGVVGVELIVSSGVGVTTGVETLAVSDRFVSACRRTTSFSLSSNHPACTKEERASNASRF